MSQTATALAPLLPARSWRRRYLERFAALATPTRESLTGRFRGEFIGPWWLRHGAPVLLAVLGMRGWWGKDFGEDGRGRNLVRRREGLRPAVPLVLREACSSVDGRRGVQVEYPPECPWRWRLFVDELRWRDGQSLLAISRLELPLLRRLMLPFLLHRVAPASGPTSAGPQS